MLKRLAAVLLAAWSFASPAIGQEHVVGDTVQEMLPYCEKAADANSTYSSDAEIEVASFCLGLVIGVADTMYFNCRTAQGGAAAPHPALAISASLSAGAAAQTFANWARAHPENWGMSFHVGVLEALGDAYPCGAN